MFSSGITAPDPVLAITMIPSRAMSLATARVAAVPTSWVMATTSSFTARYFWMVTWLSYMVSSRTTSTWRPQMPPSALRASK